MKRLVSIMIISGLFGSGLTGCSGELTNTQKGAAIGNNWHNKHQDTVRNGAIIGGLAGALGGAAIGNQMGN